MTFTEARARRVLAELEITSCGTTTAWGSSGGGVPASKPPRSGDADAPHLRWRREFTNAANDIVLNELIDLAEAELETIRGHAVKDRPTGETEAQRIERMVRETVDWPPELIATSPWSVSAREVRSHRRRAGLDPESGRGVLDARQRVQESMLSPTDKQARIRELRDGGMPITSIAMLLNIDKSTVSRTLGKAA